MAPIIGTDVQGRKTYTFKVTETIENWVVPTDAAKVRIMTKGASGGSGRQTISYRGGYAAIMEGDFTLTPGETLKILVGKRGKNAPSGMGIGGGGGGGTFVVRGTQTPLIVAGGGGGGGDRGYGVDASLTTTGVQGAGNGDGRVGGAGGKDGMGGNRATSASGAGLLGNGANMGSGSNLEQGGFAFINGGAGGVNFTSSINGAWENHGGFGGGGAGGGTAGGGAGGYSGGGGGGHAYPGEGKGGGGGGSYNDGANQVNTLSTIAEDGEVVITVLNVAPAITLNTIHNQTFYENDTLVMDGTVSEADVGDTVTVRYQIGAGTVRAIKAFLSTGALESFGKQLTFKGGNLYDGETLIASNLTDGVAHTLKVYATDDKGGTSAIIERTFYVVPNRVPLLTINTPVIEGNINADLITINGTFSDPDANNAIVSYRINGGSSVQIAEGTSGVFDFTVSFGQLIVGDNAITVEVIDSYGAKTTKTIKLNKKAIETPLLKSTQRYQLLPPSGSVVGVLFYIQRDAALDMDVSISMTQAVEAEQYVPIVPVTTAPISQGSSIVEDEYYYASSDPAEKILLQIDFTRTSLTADEKIYVVMGAFE